MNQMSQRSQTTLPERVGSRRQLLNQFGGGFAATAAAAVLGSDRQRGTHFPPHAHAVIQIFCPGGLSQIDTFDHKPELTRRNGTPFDSEGVLQFFASKPGACRGSFWRFRQHGESGLWMSELLPRLSRCVDDMAFVYSMKSRTALHGPACFMMNTGFTLPGFPAMGSWLTYGLGSAADDLPGFVVLPDQRGLPPGGVINWGAGFLPAEFQGTPLNLSDIRCPLPDLFPPDGYTSGALAEQQGLQLLDRLNRRHLQLDRSESELEARIRAYEMAARLQLSAPEAADLTQESTATAKLYHLQHPEAGGFGRQCLLARRLVERGVRFVQIYCGAENTTARRIRPNWDSHEDLPRDHGYWGDVLDRGAAGLLQDLRERGMLDQTLVICTTEFGRQPAGQGANALGRDHNGDAFTAWLAGGGIRGGTAYGATDELGYQAVDQVTMSYDLHATALHLLGIDHTRLTWYHNGIERRLTDVHGHVIRELLH